MGQSSLNHLMILNIYKEALDEMYLIQIANEYVSGREYFLQMFGNFN